MLLSMTGHGEARCREDGIEVAVELRTVNNRYLKVSFRSSDGYGSLEPKVEGLIRRHIRRGSVQASIRIERETTADDYRLNQTVLASYLNQLRSMSDDMEMPSIRPDALLALPGVVDERVSRHVDVEAVWALVKKAVGAALDNLAGMRREEGAAMASDLTDNCQSITQLLGQIEERAPLVVEAYRHRLTDRLNTLLEQYEIRVEIADVVREVGIFAERGDISEEIVRLKSHLDQFASIASERESNGRKLEFIIQEMLRETNTIGSKANDAEIAHCVIDIKAAIERMREMIQNVE